MQSILYKYILLHQQFSLPGIGTIKLQRQPAQLDIANKRFLAPFYNYNFDASKDAPSESLFNWLAQEMNIEIWDAVKKINAFSLNLKNTISQEEKVLFDKIGILKRDEKGAITMENLPNELQTDFSVAANKVIRLKEEHTIRVGETERSSIEMEAFLTKKQNPVDYVLRIAISLSIVCFLIVGWYFSDKKFTTTSIGNQTKIRLK